MIPVLIFTLLWNSFAFAGEWFSGVLLKPPTYDHGKVREYTEVDRAQARIARAGDAQLLEAFKDAVKSGGDYHILVVDATIAIEDDKLQDFIREIHLQKKRDVIFVQLPTKVEEKSVDDLVKVYPNPPFGWQRFREWTKATLKRPTWWHVKFGILWNGLPQSALAGIVAYCKDPSQSVIGPIAVTFAFSSLIGMNHETFRKFMNRGPFGSRYLKMMAISFLYSYPLTLTVKPLSAIADWATHLNLIHNAIINNVGKTSFMWLPVLRERNRRVETEAKENGIELSSEEVARSYARQYQIWYMIPFLAKILDIIGIPAGKVALYAQVPIGYLVARWYAKKHNLSFPEGDAISGKAERIKGVFRRRLAWLKERAVPEFMPEVKTLATSDPEESAVPKQDKSTELQASLSPDSKFSLRSRLFNRCRMALGRLGLVK